MRDLHQVLEPEDTNCDQCGQSVVAGTLAYYDEPASCYCSPACYERHERLAIDEVQGLALVPRS